MITLELTQYIKKSLQRSIPKEKISHSLILAGWRTADIEEAFLAVENQIKIETPAAPVLEPLTAAGETPITAGLPGPFTLLFESLRIYKKRFITLFFTPIVSYIILALLGAVTALAFSLIVKKSLTELTDTFSSNWLITVPVVAVVLIVATLIGTWGQIALLEATCASAEEKIGIIEAYRRSRGKIFYFSWLFFLGALVSLGGLALLLIPGFIILVWFSTDTYVLIKEGDGGFSAMLKSKEYVKGHFFKVFINFVLLGVFAGLFCVVIALPIYLIGRVWLKLDKETVDNLANSVSSLFVSPFVAVYGYLVYSYLRNSKGPLSFAPSRKSKAWLTIISLIGLLAVIAIPAVLVLSINPAKQMQMAKDSGRVEDLKVIRQGLGAYFLSKGKYPVSLRELIPDYLKKMPADPQSQEPYEYQTENKGKDYKLCAVLETAGRKCLSSAVGGPALRPSQIN